MRIFTTAYQSGRRRQLPSCKSCGDRRPAQLLYRPTGSSEAGSFSVLFRCTICQTVIEATGWRTTDSDRLTWYEAQDGLKGDRPRLFYQVGPGATIKATSKKGA